jgi:hypothetical protein
LGSCDAAKRGRIAHRRVILGPRYAIRLGQVREARVSVWAKCMGCRHEGQIAWTALMWGRRGRRPDNTHMRQLEPLLVCRRCGARLGSFFYTRWE